MDHAINSTELKAPKASISNIFRKKTVRFLTGGALALGIAGLHVVNPMTHDKASAMADELADQRIADRLGQRPEPRITDRGACTDHNMYEGGMLEMCQQRFEDNDRAREAIKPLQAAYDQRADEIRAQYHSGDMGRYDVSRKSEMAFKTANLRANAPYIFFGGGAIFLVLSSIAIAVARRVSNKKDVIDTAPAALTGPTLPPPSPRT